MANSLSSSSWSRARNWIGVPRYVRTDDPVSFDTLLRLDDYVAELPPTTDMSNNDV